MLSVIAFACAAICATDSDTVALGTGAPPPVRYRYAGVPFKPYADVVATPDGRNVVREAPADHKHHHGLMFAIKVNGVNFWEETQGCGYQRHGGFSRQTDQLLEERVDWEGPDGGTLMTETRRLELLSADGQDCTLLSWHALLQAPASAAATLGGNHYHGLGMRFVASMDKEARFIHPSGAEGESVRGTERLTPGGWCAVTGPVEGKPVTVAMFCEHPKTLWFTMNAPFAYMSATLNLHREPLTIPAGQSMALRFGVAVWDGEVAAEEIQGAMRTWREAAPGH